MPNKNQGKISKRSGKQTPISCVKSPHIKKCLILLLILNSFIAYFVVYIGNEGSKKLHVDGNTHGINNLGSVRRKRIVSILDAGSTKDTKNLDNETKPCRHDFIYYPDIVNPLSFSSKSLIPKVFYQTSKSRCIHKDISSGLDAWRNQTRFSGFSFFLYDDEAMDNFLFKNKTNQENWSKVFPSLQLALDCAKVLNNPTLKADIWRYLILWEHGGFYADIDCGPKQSFNADIIRDDDDGLFFTQHASQFMAQYFFAISPKHPLMFHTIRAAAQLLMNVTELREIRLPMITGPGALALGMATFRGLSNGGRHLSADEVYHESAKNHQDYSEALYQEQKGGSVGYKNGKDQHRSVRVVGKDGKFVYDDASRFSKTRRRRKNRKKIIYEEMDMIHYRRFQNVGKGSCYEIMEGKDTGNNGFEDKEKSDKLFDPTKITLI